MVGPCTLLFLLAATFQAPNQALVRGRLEDPLGRPAEGAEVTSRVWPGVDKVAVCNAEGRFELRVEWPEHQRDTYHECRVLAPGCALWSTSGELRPGEELDLGTVRLEPGGSVRGTLRLGTAPAGTAQVLVIHAENLPGEPGQRFEVCPPAGPAFHSTHEPEPVYPQPVAVAASRPDGSYRILGLPPGRYGLWARSEASYWGTSAAFEVRAAAETELPELVLEVLPPHHRIAGVVLDPDGLPVAGASIEARTLEPNRECFQREATSDASGRFELHVLPLACGAMELRAEVPDGRFSDVRVGPVAPGTGDVELRLGRMQELRVRVVGRDGLPVERYGWGLELEDDSGSLMSGSRPEERPEGRATLRFPAGSLRRLTIEAPGYREQRVDLKKGADELLVSLRDALPAIAGFVTAGGAPVAGAHVDLVLEDGDLVDDLLGHPERRLYYCTPGDCTASAADGSFSIPNDWPRYRWRVRAWAEGFAPAYSAEVRGAAAGIELELSAGGTLAGELRLAAGDPAGIRLSAHRGDVLESSNCQVGRRFHVLTQADGSYRVPHLEPGPWLLAPELSPGALQALGWSAKDGELARATPFLLTVTEGRETLASLELRQPGGSCRLRGTLTAPEPITTGYAYLLLQGEHPLRVALGDVEEGGRFELATRAPGTYRLVVNAGPGHHEARLVTDLVTLAPGEQSWERSLTPEQWKEEGVRLDPE